MLRKIVLNIIYSYILTIHMKKSQIRNGHLDSQTFEEIELKRQFIERIKANNLQKLEESNKEVAENEPPLHSHPHTSTSTVIDPASEYPAAQQAQETAPDKNPAVSDTDKMLFDKKFKNYLNHRQEYIQRARNKGGDREGKRKGEKKLALDLGDAEYYNQQEVLSNTGSDYQYQNASDMQAAYEEMTTGKKRKGGHHQIFPCESYQNELRHFEFNVLLGESEEEQKQANSISKDRLLNYLFDEPAIMMLYSINPYQLGDQLAEFETANNDLMNFQQFSSFLLADREPTYFDYTTQNLHEARKLGRGIKCAPIIGKWIDQTGILDFLVQTFKSLDIRGDSRVDRVFLAKKIRKQASVRRISEAEVIEIVNINKNVPLSRLLYEIQFEQREGDQSWSEEQFTKFLTDYKRRVTPEKGKLITRLILTGKYDSSYVYVVSQEVLEIVKQIFDKTPKFAQYFVLKQKFIQNICKDPRYKRLQSMWVRSEANRYVKRETVEDTMIRMLAEGDEYLDIEEILDFFTNRGRPKLVEHRVYLQNLERQIAIIEEEQKARREKYGQNCDTASSDEEFNQIIRQKQIKRKRDKLKKIRSGNNFDADKKFSVTIPIPFDFDRRDKQKKVSIREKKLKEMLQEKESKLKEQLKPIQCREVPSYVKEHLYERMIKEQERERKERLQKFRLQIMSQIQVSERLMRPKSKELHCDFSSPDYKFQARPMPWYCEVNLIDRINKKKRERHERILEEIINRNTEFDLPEGVQRMMKRQDEIAQKKAAKARTASTGSLGQCTFMPKISYGVPDFKTIHQHLHFDLENAKNIKEPIHPEPFSFENRPAKSKTTYEARKPPRPEQIRFSKYQKGENEEDFQNIPKTQKFQALVELRRKQLEEKEREKERKKRQEVARKLRESKFAPVVWKALRRSAIDPQKSRAFIADKLREFKRQERQKKEDYENQMLKILTKVYERPLLLQSGVNEEMMDLQGRPLDNQMPNPKYPNENFHNEAEYLDGGYFGQRQQKQAELKLNLQKQRGLPHLNEEARRAVVQGHHLEQYPPEGYQSDYQEQDQEGFHQSDMLAEEYGAGNLHTS